MCYVACVETLKCETVLNGGTKFFLLKLFFHTQQCHGKTSKQESQSISFIKEYKNRRRKPNKSQTA